MSFQLPAEASPAGLTLRVRDPGATLAFYRDLLGLGDAGRDGPRILLAPGDRRVVLELHHEPGAAARPPRSLGLYHFALLLPDRPALAAVLRRLLEARWPFDGASDHGVSEALYLRDPEGNGIELYRDRPREDWPYRASDGDLEMVTAPLDVEGLLDENPRAAPLADGTRLGHMHLRVDTLSRAEEFYAGGLGLQVTQRSYPGALFLSTGGYHHHLGVNIWGRGTAAPGAAGLVRYAWTVPGGTVDALGGHLKMLDIPAQRAGNALTVVDPIGVEVVVREES